MEDGEHKPNLKGQVTLQRLVEGYVLFLSDRIDRGEIKETNIVTLVPAIKLFLEEN